MHPYSSIETDIYIYKNFMLLTSSLGELMEDHMLQSNLDSLRDRRQVAAQCGVLPPGFVQDCSQHSCVIAV